MTCFNGQVFQEELLSLMPLEMYVTGDIIFEKISAVFEKQGLFCEMITESSDNHEDLLHSDICWLNKGTALAYFCKLKAHVIEFLQHSIHKKVAKYLVLLEDTEFLVKVAILCNIFGYLNILNLQLQGQDKKIEAFKKKLDIFLLDLSSGNILHSTQLHKTLISNEGR